MEYNLQHIGRDKNWLKQQLEGQNIQRIEDVFLAISDRQDNFYAYPKMQQVIDRDILG
jgi:uncharacterized membrane protein YcaP (DUF421 family)